MAMTATSTRSTRRAEGSLAHPHSLSLPHTEKHRATRHHHLQLQHQQSNSSRPLKRLHEATNLAYDLKPAKKTKFEIEIPSKSQYQARLYPENIDSRQQQQPPPPQPLAQAQAQTHAQHSHHRPARVVSVSAPHDKPPKHDVRQAATATRAAVPIPEPAHAAPPPPAQKASAPPALPAETATTLKDKAVASVASASGAPTKHREKVVNGIKHELDRLQPSSADMASNSQGRKLRSQEGVRYKSELSAYFPEYDEVIGNVPKEHHTLMLDTPIVVVDTCPSSSASTSQPRSEPHPLPSTLPIRTYSDELFTNLNDSQTIDLSWLESQYKGKTLNDPLLDSYYEPIHRKEFRNEKITRNAERGRSQHEKEQVIRLLDGLRGPDWLKTMGVSGITESKKKQFEPARAHFINKCEVVLDKFRKWAAEEKRLKLEKERAAKESRTSQEIVSILNEEDEEGEQEADAEELSGEEQDEGNAAEDEGADGGGSDPLESDVDASAKQLHEEAMARSRLAAKSSRRRSVPVPQAPPPTPPEFKSFFKKPYQREAALNKTRRRGRSVMAWGHPVPEPEIQDFDLHEEYRDEDMLRARARRLRRVQRSTRNQE